MDFTVGELREVADKAQTAADQAHNRVDPDFDENYVDEGVLDRTYAEGVEDVLRWIAGDTNPTAALALVLAAGDYDRIEGGAK